MLHRLPHRLLLRLAAPFLLLAAAAAQPPAFLVLQTCGPAAWRARLGPTDLGSLLATAEAEALWRPWSEAVAAELLRRDDGAASARQRPRLHDYAGAITVAAWLEQAEDALHAPRWSLTIEAEPDGHTDLALLGDECRGFFARLFATEDKGRRWRDLEFVPPRLIDGRLVAVLAAREDCAAAAQRRAAAAPLAPPTVLRAVVDVPAALGLARDRWQNRDWYRSLLGPATQQFTVELGCAGPRLRLDLGVQFGPGARGLFAGLVPPRPGVPALERLLPPDTVAFSQSHWDPASLWEAALVAEACFEDRDLAEVRARFARWNGMDLAKDLAPLFGDEVLHLWRANAPGTKDHSVFGNLTIAVPLSAGADAVPVLRQVLARNGIRAELGGDSVLRAGFGVFPEFWLAAGHGVAVLGIDSGGRDHVEAVLARAAQEAGAPAQAVAAVPHAPPGWNGRGEFDLGMLLGRHVATARALLRTLLDASLHLPRPDAMARAAERWLPLLQRAGLAKVTTLSGTTGHGWLLRVCW
ncbi:MAG: hypothetical protein FJ265_10080 [Planctomycetes bacterium]|nr:hypothetical protein [Planctomycetota bacterium]